MRTVILWAAGQDNSTAANYTALAPVRMDPDTNTSYVNVTFMFNVESVVGAPAAACRVCLFLCWDP